MSESAVGKPHVRQVLGEVFRNHRSPVPAWARALLAAGAASAATIAIVLVATTTAGAAVLVAAVAPDLPLLLSLTPGLRAGRVHPRSVRAYNATHSLAGPALLTVTALVAGRPTVAVVAAAWWAHVLTDRACGYHLRRPDGRPRDWRGRPRRG